MCDEQQQQDKAIVCDLTVFTDKERERHMNVAGDLFSKVTELKETDEGFSLCLPDEDGIIFKIADFINDDRKCCSFIHYGMEVEPYSNGIRLTLKGDVDVKEAIRGDIISLIPDTLNS